MILILTILPLVLVHAQAQTQTVLCLGGLFQLSGTATGTPNLRAERRTAFHLAIDYVNSRRPLPFGVRLTGEASKNIFDLQGAISETTRLTASAATACGSGKVPLVGIVGPNSSSQAAVSAAMLLLPRVPSISMSASSPGLEDRAVYRYLLRTTPSDTIASEAIVDTVVALGWKTACIIFTKGELGEQGAIAVRERAQKAGLYIAASVMVGLETIASLSTTNVTQNSANLDGLVVQLAGLKPSNKDEVDRCFINIVYCTGTLTYLPAALSRAGLISPKRVYIAASISSFLTPELSLPGLFARGDPPTVDLMERWLGVAPEVGSAATNPVRADLDAMWTAKASAAVNNQSNLYWDDGDGRVSEPKSLFAFDAVLAFAEALRSVLVANKSVLDGPAVLEALYTLSNVTGATGNVSFDRKTGGRPKTDHSLLQVRGGAFVKVGLATSEGVSWQSPEAADLSWGEGKSGLKDKPLDYLFEDKVAWFSLRYTIISLVLLLAILSVSWGLNKVKMRLGRPIPRDISHTVWIVDAVVWVSLALEQWQLLSLSIVSGPQNLAPFVGLQTGMAVSVPELLDATPSFLIAAAAAIIVLFVSLPLSLVIADEEHRGGLRGKFPGFLRGCEQWLGLMAPISIVYFKLSAPVFLPILVHLLKPLACAETIVINTPGKVVRLRSVGTLVCGTRTHSIQVALAVVLALLYACSHLVVEPFLDGADKGRSIHFCPAANLQISLLKVVSISSNSLSQGFRGLGLGVHCISMLICTAVARTTPGSVSLVDFFTSETLPPDSNSATIGARYRRMLMQSETSVGGSRLFSSSELASRFRRLGFLGAAAGSLIELVIFAFVRRNRSPTAQQSADAAVVGFWCLIAVWALLAIEFALATLVRGRFGGPSPLIADFTAKIKNMLLQTGAAAKLRAFSAEPAKAKSEVVINLDHRAATSILLRWRGDEQATAIVFDTPASTKDIQGGPFFRRIEVVPHKSPLPPLEKL
jgi:ABC-type branched-subunit amino acid transport system substrate-binding protein